jgi:hypothetical protein
VNEIHIQFSSSTAWQSDIIRRLCHSAFSHVDIVVESGLLGVSGEDHKLGDTGGVLIRSFTPWPYIRPPNVARISTPHAERIIEIAKSQIGKPFDNGALYDFLSDNPGDRQWRNKDKWFCSELVAFALEGAGLFPYTLIPAKNRITPADLLLLLNPFMTEDNIKEF